jgi:smad nuclear-interacting protein 1
MDPVRASRLEKADRHPRRSRSSSLDSEEERRRRRRRKEYEMSERDDRTDRRDDRSGRDRNNHGERGEKDRERQGERERDRDSRRHEGGGRDKYNDRETKRRRSRSPAVDSSRRRHEEDRSIKHRSSRDRSPSNPSQRDKDYKSSREDSAIHVSRKNKGPLPSQAASFQAKSDPNSALVVAEGKEPVEKEKPNFAPSGLLAAASNSVTQADGTSIALKYHEPPEARKPPPKDEWKLFVFKGSDIVETIDLSKRSCWLVGRETAVVDLEGLHPSISKQHAVIQFRYIEKKNEFGDRTGRVRPYLIDLESANGTSLNKEDTPPSRYLELRDKDMIQFGHSTREYVLMLSPKS